MTKVPSSSSSPLLLLGHDRGVDVTSAGQRLKRTCWEGDYGALFWAASVFWAINVINEENFFRRVTQCNASGVTSLIIMKMRVESLCLKKR